MIAAGSDGAAIGSGASGSSVDHIVINGGDITARNIGGAGIGGGMDSPAGDIVINGGKIQAYNSSGAGIGAGSFYKSSSSVGNITIADEADVYAQSVIGYALGRGGSYDSNVHTTIKSSAGSITEHGGVYGKKTEYNRTYNTYDHDGPGTAVAPEPDNTTSADHTTGAYWEDRPLVIHTGIKSNQALHIYIESMRPEAIGIDKAAVTTREKATAALGIVDTAIQYALDNATRVGAYSQELFFTQANLVTANENTQASESVIRDADMAQEMMHYARENVLAQAAQSMLGQANQAGSSVLSLLQ